MKQIINKTIIELSLVTSIIYIIWRIIFTIPTKFGKITLIVGIIYIFIEIWDFIEFLIHYINILRSSQDKNNQSNNIKQTNNQIPDIDIIIATINESKELLSMTIEGCLNIEYPEKNKMHIYICDDGKRKEIENLAKNYNIGYITRDNNIDAKAGNYNNALKYLKSKYILTLDADMIPNKDILKETIPYFLEDEKVGFVQTPQYFYNYDIYQYRFGLKEQIPFDQNFFYNVIQKEKEKINATVYCGTNAIISRNALNAIGGFAKGTLTEDIATGMLIQSAGYKGKYINKILAKGYATNDIDSFIKQRERWAVGCIQMEKKYHILKMNGLNLRQKLEYLSCVSYWLFGIKTIAYLLAPVLFSVLKIIIISCNFKIFVAMWLPQFILKRFALDKVFDNIRSATWNKIYDIILFPKISIAILKELIGIEKKEFEVSKKYLNKDRCSKKSVSLFIVHLAFLVFNIISYCMCIDNVTIYILPLLWSLVNIFYLSIAIIFDITNRGKNIVKNKTNEDIEIKYSKKAIMHIFL